MAVVTYNLIGKTLRETFLLLPLALEASIGLAVEVGPFDDSVLPKTYVWIKGELVDVDAVFVKLDRAVEKEGIHYIKTPVKFFRVKE